MFQSGATAESTASYRLHSVGYPYACDARTSAECMASDIFNAVGNDYLINKITTEILALSYSRSAFGNDEFCVVVRQTAFVFKYSSQLIIVLSPLNIMILFFNSIFFSKFIYFFIYYIFRVRHSSIDNRSIFKYFNNAIRNSII